MALSKKELEEKLIASQKELIASQKKLIASEERIAAILTTSEKRITAIEESRKQLGIENKKLKKEVTDALVRLTELTKNFNQDQK